MIARVGRISSVLALWLVASSALAQEVSPPSTKDSVQFLVMGDTGTGDRAQYEVAAQMVKPQKGIYYFISGGGAKLRDGDIVEIAGDVLTFQTLSRTGKRVDTGAIRRPVAAEPTTTAAQAAKN